MTDDIKRKNTNIDPRDAWEHGFGPMPQMPRYKPEPRAKNERTRAPLKWPKMAEFVNPGLPMDDPLPTGDARQTELTRIEAQNQNIQGRIRDERNSLDNALGGVAQQSFIVDAIKWFEDRQKEKEDAEDGPPDPNFKPPLEDLDGKTRDQQLWLMESKNQRQYFNRLGQLQAYEQDVGALFNKGTVSGMAATAIGTLPENALAGMAGGAGAATFARNVAFLARNSKNIARAANIGQLASGVATTGFQATVNPNVTATDVAIGAAMDWASAKFPHAVANTSARVREKVGDIVQSRLEKKAAGEAADAAPDAPAATPEAKPDVDTETPAAETAHGADDELAYENPADTANRIGRYVDAVQIDDENIKAVQHTEPEPAPHITERIDPETGEITGVDLDADAQAIERKRAEQEKAEAAAKPADTEAKKESSKTEQPEPEPEDPRPIGTDHPVIEAQHETINRVADNDAERVTSYTEAERRAMLEDADADVAREVLGDQYDKLTVNKSTRDVHDIVANKLIEDAKEGGGLAVHENGVHVIGQGVKSGDITAIKNLLDTFAPTEKIVIRGGTKNGGRIVFGNKTAIIDIPGSGRKGNEFTIAHEVGHKVVADWISSNALSKETRTAFRDLVNEIQVSSFKGNADSARKARSGATPFRFEGLNTAAANERSLVEMMKGVYKQDIAGTKGAAYHASRQEISADLFQKYIEKVINRGPDNPKSIPKKLVNSLRKLYTKFLDLIRASGTPLDSRAEAFFDGVADAVARRAERAEAGAAKKAQHAPRDAAAQPLPASPEAFEAKPLPQKKGAYGIGLVPNRTPKDAAVHQALKIIIDKAKAEAPDRVAMIPLQERITKSPNPETVGNSLISASAIMAASKNAVIRWMGARLAESPSGAIGGARQKTAAIRKFALKNYIIGTSMHELDEAASAWAKAKGYGVIRRAADARLRDAFNKELTDAMIEYRKGVAPADPALLRGVQAWEAMASRVIDTDRKFRQVGATTKPNVSPKGYMPRRLDGSKVAELTYVQRQKFQDAIKRYFLSLGWSDDVAEKTARGYLDYAARQRLGVSVQKSLDMTDLENREDIVKLLMGQGMDEAKARKLAGGFAGSLDSHLKHRIDIDENMDLGGIKIKDLMVNDHTFLMRSLADNTSGWAAMSEIGVYSKGQLDMIREAVAVGTGEHSATAAEMRAFDQVVAEITGQPFGTAGQSKALAAVQSLTSVTRLGGLVFNNVPEIFNLAGAAGVTTMLKFFPSIRKMRREILDLRAGKPPANSILSSIEQHYGAPFGTEGYLLATPWDSPGQSMHSGAMYEDGVAMRAVNAIGHAQTVITGVRAVTAAQTRYTAQEMTRLALEYAQGYRGGNLASKYLADAGLSEDFINRVRPQLAAATTWSGKHAVGFDISKLEPADADTFSQAIYRSARQIIQGGYAGETGAWVHSDIGRAMGQFKSFAILSLEKQQLRQWSNMGPLRFTLTFAATMAACLPIHMMRVYWNSLGKDEESRHKYLNDALSPYALATAAMTYMSTSGMLPDLLQMLGQVATSNIAPEGFRKAAEKAGLGGYNDALIGGAVMPAVGMANDMYSALQGKKSVTRVIPGLNAAPLVPLMNMFRKEADEFMKDKDEDQK